MGIEFIIGLQEKKLKSGQSGNPFVLKLPQWSKKYIHSIVRPFINFYHEFQFLFQQWCHWKRAESDKPNK